MMPYLLLVIGFVLLIKGADFFVDGAASIAYQFQISTVIVGLTIVALGTSLPEAAVSISASLAGANQMAISNVIGSNIFNTLVVVGASAILAPFVIPSKVINRDLGFNIFCSVLLLVFLVMGGLNRLAGAVLVVLLAGYIYFLIQDARRNPEPEDEEKKVFPLGKSILFCVGGAAAIMLGGNLTVENARLIAAMWGMSERLIALTIVSVGTSLPELVTSVVAAQKGESGLSIGNAVGSSILNILFILGFSSLVSPLSATIENVLDGIILAAIAVGFFLMAKLSGKVGRIKGIGMLACYAVYLAFIILR